MGKKSVGRKKTAKKKPAKKVTPHTDSFRQLFANLPSCAALYESTSGGRDFIFKDFNRAAERTDKIKRKDVLGKSVRECFPSVVKFGLFAVFKRVYKTGKPENHPITLYKDERIQGYRENYVYKLPTGDIVAVYEDKTAEKQAAEALAASEKRHRGLMTGLPVGYAELDIKGGFVFTNAEHTRIHGYSAQEFARMKMWDLLPTAAEKRDLRDFFKHLVKEHPGPKALENKNRRKDGTLIDVYVRWDYIRDAAGALTGFSSIVYDITKTKTAERKMAESETRFRALFEKTVDGIIVADAATKRFVDCNEQVVKMLGYSKEELLTRRVADIHPKKDLPYVVEQFEKQKRGEFRLASDIPVQHKDGSVFFCDVNSNMVDLNGKLCLVGVFRDVTARKAGEDALRAANQFNKEIIAGAQGIIVYDKELRFLVWNEKMERISGVPASEVLGKRALDVFPFLKEQGVDKMLQRALAGVEVQSPDRPFNHKAGKGWVTSRYVPHRDSDGNIVGVIVTVDDITTRKQAEIALGESERRFRDLTESSSDWIWEVDKEGVFTYVSPQVKTLIGYEPGEVVGHSLFEFMPPQESARVLEFYRKNIGQHNSFANFEHVVLAKDGRESVIETSGVPIITHDGNILGYRGINRDVTTRKMSERALAESEEMFRTIGTSAQDAIVMMNPQGDITFWSDAAERIFGHSREEAMGRSCHDLLMPERYREAYQKGIAQFRCGGQGDAVGRTLELTARRKGGEEFPIEISVSAVRKEDGWHAIGIVRDISERKLSEAALAESEEKFLRIIENLRQDYFFYSHDTNGVFTYLSPSVTDVTGHLPEEFLKHYEEHMTDHPLNQDVIRHTELSIQGIKQPPYLVQVWSADRERRIWLEVTEVPVKDADGKMISVEGIAHDVTEARRVSHAREILRQLVEHSNDAVFVVDPVKGRFLDVNSTACERLGYSREELLRMGPPDIDQKVFSQITWQEHIASLRNSSPQLIEAAHRRKDGSLFPVEISAQLLEQDGTEYMLAVGRDLSERKKAEEDLQASREQLLQSQKLEAVGRLAGGVAHDFNNLCTVIRGCADFLGKNTPPDDPRREDIDEIAQAGARAANLTRQLLALSRKQVLQPKTLSLGTIVLGMRSMLERTLGEDITLLTQLSAEAAPVRVDPGQIEQVLLNLAVNAREAMPRGGKLIIGCADVRSGKEYRPKGSTIPPGNYVCLTVSDTGCGMDAATKERAFEPFFTTKGFGQSSGLGLSTAYGIVRQSGGYMSLDSEVGRGTTFKIHLPAAAGADEQTPAKRAPAVRGSGTILLVEDDARVRRTARRALEAAGYTVIEADCGAAALRLLERDKPEFDLLVTDVIMPEMDGPQLVDEIARRRPGVPTLYMSGYTGEMLIMRGILEEDEAFLAKPFTPDDLAHKVAAVLAAHRRG